MKYALITVAILILGVGAFWGYSSISNDSSEIDSSSSSDRTPVSEKGEGPVSGGTDTESVAAIIEYTDEGFSPRSATISVGDTVEFRNNGDGEMWVASDDHPIHALLPEFDQLGAGNSYSYTFEKPGLWGFHNHLDASDIGTVNVTE